MDLREILRNKVIKDVLRVASIKDTWHVLVYNKSTACILTKIFTKTQILSNEILSMQRLELTRDPIAYPAIYFVKYCKETQRAIRKDVKTKMYTKYYIVHVNKIRESEKIPGENIHYKYVDINFIVLDERIFTRLDDLKDAVTSFASTLQLQFHSINLRADRALYDALCEVYSENGASHGYYNADLVILDRSFDLITPLIHFFNFESFLKDFDLSRDAPTDSPLYREIRYVHIADTNRILNEKARGLVEGFKKIDDKTNINEIRKLVLEAPENIKLKKSVNAFINLAEDSLNLFESEKLSMIAELEQNICTGYNSKGARYYNGVKDTFEILNQDIKRECKVRFIFLLLSVCYDFQGSEVANLKEKLMLTEKELRILEKLTTMRKGFNKRREFDSKFVYEISRYDPLLHDLLRAFVQNKNNRFSNLVKKEMADKKESLRKSSFVFKKHETKKKTLVLYIDVITYPEIMLINQMSEKSTYEIFVCTDRIVSPKEYLEWLEELKV